ncbi:uncharacterized protein [Watersipora subatra]|uniref:uncharacterized protein n=1 Tax=Watersipora subatra TaxID=2589382 RepID=UPI00355C2996
MGDCKPADTPAAMGLQLTNPTDEEHNAFLDTKFPYRQAIGSLIYLMTATRPNLSWVVSKLSQFLECPGPAHTTAVNRVFRYIKGTLTHNLHFTKTSGTLTGYTDSNWAGDINDRRSTTGYVFDLESAPISWKTRKQHTVALSSCEAEYLALAEATKETLFL